VRQEGRRGRCGGEAEATRNSKEPSLTKGRAVGPESAPLLEGQRAALQRSRGEISRILTAKRYVVQKHRQHAAVVDGTNLFRISVCLMSRYCGPLCRNSRRTQTDSKGMNMPLKIGSVPA
jgi:hypothetical protein